MTVNVAIQDHANKCQIINKEQKQYRMLFPELKCAQCDALTVCGARIVPVAEDSYYDCYADGTRWWPSDIIKTFGVLKSHEMHREDMIFVDAGTPTKKAYQERYTKTHELPKKVQTIVTVAMKEAHFVVLKIRLDPDCTTVVYDGMAAKKGRGLEPWKEVEEYILSRYGISKKNSSRRWIMRHHKDNQDFKRPLNITQVDGHSCGPIACRVLWDLLAPGEIDRKYHTIGVPGSVRGAKAGDEVSDWRKIVIEELKTMVKKYSGDCKIKNRKRKGTDGDKDSKKRM